MSLRVLVCGGRVFDDWWKLCTVLDGLSMVDGVSVIIHGGADGADRMADNWAYVRHIPVLEYNIKRGRETGFERNQRMLEQSTPDLVIAFQGGNGTADMVRRAKRAEIEVREIA